LIRNHQLSYRFSVLWAQAIDDNITIVTISLSLHKLYAMLMHDKFTAYNAHKRTVPQYSIVMLWLYYSCCYAAKHRSNEKLLIVVQTTFGL